MAENGPHIVIACGGTGGHFYPTLAIARELRDREVRLTLVVAGHHSVEQLRMAEAEGFAARGVSALRLPRLSLAALAFPWRFLGCILESRRALRELQPSVVLGMGSFASVPACLAAVTRRVPLALHEGNAWIGRANRLLSRWARVLATSLPLAPGQKCGCPHRRTGMPLRQDLLSAAQNRLLPGGFFQSIGLLPGCPVLLVFGGSQGAKALNDTMMLAMIHLRELAPGLQIVHLTGTDENAPLREAYAAVGVRASVRRADAHIENCYLAADLVLCRAGASTISELALFAKPAVLVPFPQAADDHQTANARGFVNAGAARLLAEADATPEAVAALIRDWLEAPRKWRKMGEQGQALASPRAAAAVADLVLQVAERGGG